MAKVGGKNEGKGRAEEWWKIQMQNRELEIKER